MQPTQGKEQPKRKRISLGIRTDLLQIACSDNVNLSSMLESCLLDYSKKKLEKEWLEANKEGIEAYNNRIDRYGVFGPPK